MCDNLSFPNNGSSEEKAIFLSNVLNLDCSTSNVHLQQLKGGITNSVYLLKTPEKRSIVRIFGNNTDKIIDRKSELNNIKTANMIKIYATFKNGMVCSYQEGKSISLDMMRSPLISNNIAKQLGSLHKSTYFNVHKKNEVFNRINVFINKLNPDFSKNGVYVNIDDIKSRLRNLQASLADVMRNRPLCLSHNDLLAGNILWDGEEAGFVDYEYSGYTWPEYDIANHFLEWCGFELDLQRFPSVYQQKEFLREYLLSLYGKEPTEDIVSQWQERVEKLVKLSHLFWGSWAFFQAANSTVDFPYFEYGVWRIKLMDYDLPLNEGHELLGSNLVSLQ